MTGPTVGFAAQDFYLEELMMFSSQAWCFWRQGSLIEVTLDFVGLIYVESGPQWISHRPVSQATRLASVGKVIEHFRRLWWTSRSL